MTQEKVGKKEPQLVLESPDFHEFYAELSGITGYNTPAGSFIHIAFMSPSVTNYRGAMGEPSSSDVVMKKVGAVTLPSAMAEALHLALGQALKQHNNVTKGE